MQTTLLAVLAAAAACAGPQKSSGGAYDQPINFECKDRRAEYLLVGGFAAAEVGVSVSCDNDQPSMTKWFLEDGKPEPERQTFEIPPSQFEELWQQLEDAGWRNLSNCNNPDAGDSDQVATFDISDGDGSVNLVCQGQQMPFPFDRLANAFEALSRQHGSR